MAGAVRASSHLEVSAALEDAVEDCLSEVTIMKDVAEGRQRLVGGDEDGASLEIAFVDDAVEDVGGIVGVGEVADRRR